MLRYSSCWRLSGLRFPKTYVSLRVSHNRFSSESYWPEPNVSSEGSFKQVSKQFKANEKDLVQVLSKFGTDIRENPDGRYELKECKLCTKGNRDKPDNLWKLSVWPTGSYNCFRCSCSGNWNDLKLKADNILESDHNHTAVNIYKVNGGSHGNSNGNNIPKAIKPYNIPTQTLSYKAYYNLFPNNQIITEIDQINHNKVKEYLNNVRGINDDILSKYKVGYTTQQFLNNDNIWVDQVCITFPWIIRREEIKDLTVKYGSVVDERNKKNSSEELIVRMKYR